ncbi:MurR/RpiR family transcriptional regulator, partial [Pediococcus pentosaceus]
MANDNLSSTEQFVWKFIQDNLELVPFLSIVELSERANVSTATIIRALRKKGFTGFSDFKHGVAKNNSSKDFTNLERADSDIKSAILKNEHEVTNTIKMINIPDIEQSVQRIKHAK